MLAFINVHNLHKTSREVVSAYSFRVAEPVTVFAPVITMAEPVAIAPPVAAPVVVAAPPVTVAAPVVTPPSGANDDATTARCTVDRRAFLNSVKQAAQHAPKAFRRAVVLTIDRKNVDLTSVDADCYFMQCVPAENITRGTGGAVAVVIPAKRVADMLGKIKAQRVQLVATVDNERENATFEINVDGAAFSVPAEHTKRIEPNKGTGKKAATGNVATFELDTIAGCHQNPFESDFASIVTAGELRRAIARTEFATDTESTRYALGGILFELEPFALNLAATDSRRLAVERCQAESVGNVPSGSGALSFAVVPWDICAQLKTALDRLTDSKPVTVAVSITETVIETPNGFSLRCRNAEGRFPRYRDVVPKSCNFAATFKRSELLSAVLCVATAADKESPELGLSWHLDGNQACLLTCQSDALGRSSMPVAMETESGSAADVDAFSARDSKEYKSNGKDFALSFNPFYLADFLDNSKADKVTLKVLSHNSAAIITDTTDATGYMILMPLSRD